MAEPDPQRTLAEAAAAEPAVSSAAPMLDRIPSDAATIGSDAPPLATLQGLSPSVVAVPASEGPPQGFGAVGEPSSAVEEPASAAEEPIVGRMPLSP